MSKEHLVHKQEKEKKNKKWDDGITVLPAISGRELYFFLKKLYKLNTGKELNLGKRLKKLYEPAPPTQTDNTGDSFETVTGNKNWIIERKFERENGLSFDYSNQYDSWLMD